MGEREAETRRLMLARLDRLRREERAKKETPPSGAVPYPFASDLSPNECLCGVDIQATADQAGWHVADRDQTFGEWTLRKL